MQATNGGTPSMARRESIRHAGVALAALTAVMYFLIGLNVVTVVDLVPGEPSPQPYFGIPAGLAYALGALLLFASESRLVWILGALLQVFVIFMYFNLAADRVPAFERWGILIRVAQVLLLGSLLYLLVDRHGAGRPRTATT